MGDPVVWEPLLYSIQDAKTLRCFGSGAERLMWLVSLPFAVFLHYLDKTLCERVEYRVDSWLRKEWVNFLSLDPFLPLKILVFHNNCTLGFFFFRLQKNEKFCQIHFASRIGLLLEWICGRYKMIDYFSFYFVTWFLKRSVGFI